MYRSTGDCSARVWYLGAAEGVHNALSNVHHCAASLWSLPALQERQLLIYQWPNQEGEDAYVKWGLCCVRTILTSSCFIMADEINLLNSEQPSLGVLHARIKYGQLRQTEARPPMQ